MPVSAIVFEILFPDRPQALCVAQVVRQLIDDPVVRIVPITTNLRPVGTPSRLDTEMYRALEHVSGDLFEFWRRRRRHGIGRRAASRWCRYRVSTVRSAAGAMTVCRPFSYQRHRPRRGDRNVSAVRPPAPRTRSSRTPPATPQLAGKCRAPTDTSSPGPGAPVDRRGAKQGGNGARVAGERVRRVGMLGVYLMPVFREGLARLGWTEGCNLRIDEFRVADAADRSAYAAELARLPGELDLSSQLSRR